MGRTFVNATINGPDRSKEYRFLVDTSSTYMGLPTEEIEELGLTMIPRGRARVRTATGIVEYDTYVASVGIDERNSPAIVTPSPIPLIGYEVLENLGFKVNPVTRSLEPVPLDEPHPPYQLLRVSKADRGIAIWDERS